MAESRILVGHAIVALRGMAADSIDCCVTSPPYWGLRDYGTGSWEGGDPSCPHRVGGQVADSKWQGAIVAGVRPGVDASACLECGAHRVDSQIGLEPTPQEYVESLVEVFREVRRALKPEGTCWLNLGDSYASNGGAGRQGKNTQRAGRRMVDVPELLANRRPPPSLKPKDLVGIPWRVAFALQEDGWWLRGDHVWHKPNPMPEAVKDRPTRAHEFVFLLTKSAKYRYDAEAVLEPFADARMGRDGSKKARQRDRGGRDDGFTKPNGIDPSARGGRNLRSVWTINPRPFKGAHFATFPEELPTKCLLAGSPVGGVVLDPFAGAATTGLAALRNGRDFIGIELNPEYAAMAAGRIRDELQIETKIEEVDVGKQPEMVVTGETLCPEIQSDFLGEASAAASEMPAPKDLRYIGVPCKRCGGNGYDDGINGECEPCAGTGRQRVVAFDTETHLITPGNLAPKIVCASFALRVSADEARAGFKSEALAELAAAQGSAIGMGLHANGDEGFEESVLGFLRDPDVTLVGANIAYDLAVLCSSFPAAVPLVWQALEEHRVTDVQIRERLLMLSSQGRLGFTFNADGTTRDKRYSLADLVRCHLGEDIDASKEGADSWRLLYYTLDGKRIDEYPQEAVKYAMNDACYTLRVYEAQEERIESRDRPGPSSVFTETFQTAVAFALYLTTCAGIPVDPVRKDEIAAKLREALDIENMNLLVETGILEPAKPGRPIKRNGAIVMTKGTKEKINLAKLRARVVEAAKAKGIPVEMTDKSEKFPEGQVSTADEFLQRLRSNEEEGEEGDPVIEQYCLRQEQQKVVQALENLGDAVHVHPGYNILVETGRTSSYGNRKGKTSLYPSMNVQQQDPRVRPMYVPLEGWCFVSCDFSALELLTLGQTIFDLFGRSTLRDQMLKGIDPHAHLGSRLAHTLDANFRAACDANGITSPDDVYTAFMEAKKDPEFADWWKKWRKLAKPVGLGYPGGLGPKTFCRLAKGTYGIDCDEPLAHQLRDIWHAAYPEMRDYFNWITSACCDPRHPEAYAYTTPMGMYRSNASYCAAANGKALQSPGAEGAKLAHFNVVRAMFDPTLESCLFGCIPIAFVHDEIIAMLPLDRWLHERAFTIAEIMVQSLGQVLPDMLPAIKANPAAMLRWDKNAETVLGEDGRLTIWTPKE